MTRPKVVVLGADGFIGWPVCLELHCRGFEVVFADNGSRRQMDAVNPTSKSLTQIQSVDIRCRNEFVVTNVEVTNMDSLDNMLRFYQPDAIVHLAELAKPLYSASSAGHSFRTVVNSNLLAMTNLMELITTISPKSHLVYVSSISNNTEKDPEGEGPQNVVDLSRVLNHELLQFASLKYGAKTTEIQTGMVWGTQTALTMKKGEWVNRYDHQEPFATILNRLAAYAPRMKGILKLRTDWNMNLPLIYLEDLVKAVADVVSEEPAPKDSPRVIYEVGEIVKPRYVFDRVQEWYPNLKIETGDQPSSVGQNHQLGLGMAAGMYHYIGNDTQKFSELMDFGAAMSDKIDLQDPWLKQDTIQVKPAPINRNAPRSQVA